MFKLLRSSIYLFMSFCLLNVQLGTFRYDGGGINIDDFKDKGVDIATFTRNFDEGSRDNPHPYKDIVEKQNSKRGFYIGLNTAYADTFKGKGKRDIRTAQYISLLTMIAVAFAVFAWLTTCLGGTLGMIGMIIMGIGALVYLFGEITANMKFKKLKFKTIDLGKKNEQGYYSDFQKQALEDEKKLYQEALKTAKQKKMLQTAAAAAFGIATLYEGAMCATLYGILSGCKTCEKAACLPSATACPVKCAKDGPLAARCAANCKICLKATKAVGAFTAKIEALDKKPNKSMPKKTAIKAACQTLLAETKLWSTALPECETCSGCIAPCDTWCWWYDQLIVGCIPKTGMIEKSPGMRNIAKNCVAPNGKDLFFTDEHFNKIISMLDQGNVSSISIDGFKDLSNVFKDRKNIKNTLGKKDVGLFASLVAAGMDILFTPAYGFIEYLGIAAIAIAVLLALVVGKTTMFDLFTATPCGRIILDAVIMALAFATVMVTDKIIKQLEKNIKTLDELLAKMRRQTDDFDITPGDPSATTSFVKPVDIAKPYKPIKLNKKLPCVKKGKGGKCVSTKSMVKGATSKLGKNQIKGIGAGTMSGMSDVASLGDSLQGRDNIGSGTLSQAASLGKKAAAFRRKIKGVEKKINDRLKKLGRKAIDFDGRKNALMDQLLNNTAKELKANMGNGSEQLMASLGGAPSGLGGKDDLDKAKEGLKDFKAKSDMKVVGGSGSGKKAGSGFNFDMKDDSGEGLDSLDGIHDGITDTSSGIRDANYKYKDKLGDIVDDPSVSIFKVITTRYMKKYGNFFEEE